MASLSEGGKVADAIVAGLNDETFSQTFTAAIAYGIRLKLEEADTLRVDVAPVRSSVASQTRGSLVWFNVVDIGVRYRFGTSDRVAGTGAIDPASVDDYRYLLQEISQWCYQERRLPTYQNAVMKSDLDVRADVIQKHLDEWSQFTGIVRVTYQTETELSMT